MTQQQLVDTPLMTGQDHAYAGLCREQLVGTWHLIEFRAHSPEGEVMHPFGEDPIGMMLYDPDGYMAVIFMQPGRSLTTSVASSNGWESISDEIRSAFTGFDAYCGTYTIDTEQSIITHHIRASKFPHWEGTNQVRQAAFCCGQLCLSSPPLIIHGKQWQAHAIWQRAV